MNHLLNELQPYPFERLRALMAGIHPPADVEPILLHIGEPKHATPAVVTDELARRLPELAKYPATVGLPELRQACADWLQRRYQVTLDPATQILPVNGSREALFAFVQVVLDAQAGVDKPVVVSPNPFYQIYEGAALLAGGTLCYVDCHAPDFMPDWAQVPPQVWARTQLVFVCSPGNPSGAVLDLAQWQQLFALQDQYGFVIASDECYSEIYFDEPPLGVLQAAQLSGRGTEGLMMFTSLSKRSNVPGLRSGFVAGDAALIQPFLLYRTYHGSAMSLPSQYASIAAWQDEAHVAANRALYREKFSQVLAILQPHYAAVAPQASFYLWLPVPGGDDVAFTQRLWREAGVQVLPGSLMAREGAAGNPGQGYVRMALVATLEECVAAAHRMVAMLA